MEDYRVRLPAYAGPLDLLLYLVKRHEIDLHDIPVAELTDQYLRHLAIIEAIDVERAGDFLVMAATLLEIKSRMIMPPAEAGAEGDEDGEGLEGETSGGGDPRFELVQQLLAYKRYKDVAIELELRHDEWMKRFAAAPRKLSQSELDAVEQRQLDLDDVHVMDLCEAFGRLLDSIGQTAGHEVTYDDTPISLHAADIRDRLQREGEMTLQQLFAGRRTRAEMIGLFLATLELVRDRLVRVRQHEVGGEVHLELIAPEDQVAEPSPAAPAAGEDPYDWPDPEARQAAAQRAQRRAERLAKIRAGEQVDDEDEDGAFDLSTPTVDDMLDDLE